MLTNDEKYRYSRHILLNEVGEAGQLKLKQAKILVIGAGGLGCPILQYLVAAGVGTIGVVDYDVVEESNLQRQILFTVNDIGKNKAQVAKEKLIKNNPHIIIKAYSDKLNPKNALNIFQDYDIVVDGTDNFSTRYLINDACVISNKPLVYGAIYKFQGQVAVFNYNNGPTYRCLFPEPPQSNIPNCSEIGVLGVLPGVIGALQASEVIKLILGLGNLLSGKILINNILDSSTSVLTLKRNEQQVNYALSLKDGFEDVDYEFICSIQDAYHNINIDQFKTLINKKEYIVLDVRDEWELPRLDEFHPIVAPINDIDDYVENIPKDKKVIVICQKGGRSKLAINKLKNDYGYNNLINLSEGIINWKKNE